MIILTLKLELTPLLIAVASLVQRRWGGPLGGLIAGLPLTAACAAITVDVSLVPENLALAAAIAFPTLPALVFIIGQPVSDLPVLPPPWWDTPARMVVAAGAVLLNTAAAEIRERDPNHGV